jgi:hypothetical protein
VMVMVTVVVMVAMTTARTDWFFRHKYSIE